MFTLRFDMRAPRGGAPVGDLYAAAIDMCEWAETRGAVPAVLSEHHGADDVRGDSGRTRTWRSCWPQWRLPLYAFD